MARESRIVFNINSQNGTLEVNNFLNYLQKGGWKVDHQNSIQYMIMNAGEPDWVQDDVTSLNEVVDQLGINVKSGELVGIQLYNSKENINFILYINDFFKEITFWLSADRVLIEGTDITDFSYILKVILPVIGGMKLSVEMVKCIDS